jgi:hypothetical protein
MLMTQACGLAPFSIPAAAARPPGTERHVASHQALGMNDCLADAMRRDGFALRDIATR